MPIEPATLYRKTGRRYQPVGMEFTGFPANGYWLVADGSQSLLVPAAAPRPLEKLAYQQYRDRIIVLLRGQMTRAWGLQHIVGETLNALETIINEEKGKCA
jgi:hypothetical protein